jgi:hypothetical protein
MNGSLPPVPCRDCDGTGLVLLDCFGDVVPWHRYLAEARAKDVAKGYAASCAIRTGWIRPTRCPRGCVPPQPERPRVVALSLFGDADGADDALT